jgi:glycerophosphoryl diester phosphodiesterase
MSGQSRSRVEGALAGLVGAVVVQAAGGALSLPLNVAHRGASAASHENTLVAVEAGFDAGAEVVEIDLLKSSEGEVVIFHDDTLDRTTNGMGRVDQTTLADLKLLDAGFWFAPEFVGETIPTLVEALTLQRQLGAGPLLLDQKSGILFGAEIAAAVEAVGLSASEDVWVTAWTQDQVLDIRTHLPDTFILWTGLNAGDVGIPGIAALQALGVGGFSFIFESYDTNPGFLEAVHAAGMEAYAWNLDIVLPETPEKMQAAIDMGLDGYIVNDPALFEMVRVPEPDPDLLRLGLFGLGLVRCGRGAGARRSLARASRAARG